MPQILAEGYPKANAPIEFKRGVSRFYRYTPVSVDALVVNAITPSQFSKEHIEDLAQQAISRGFCLDGSVASYTLAEGVFNDGFKNDTYAGLVISLSYDFPKQKASVEVRGSARLTRGDTLDATTILLKMMSSPKSAGFISKYLERNHELGYVIPIWQEGVHILRR